MTRLEAFVPTGALFKIVTELAVLHKAQIVFQRFQSAEHSAGFAVIEASAGAADEYLRGGYELFYLALKKAPINPQDWDFSDRETANLIEFAGGRQYGQDLEQVVIRPMAKKTKAQKLFDAVKASCEQGVILNGQPYPKIFYAKEIRAQKLRLWVDIETKSICAKIADP